MYDLSSDFKKFYYNEVVLPKEETKNLRNKKKINIQKLEDGLKEYNEENNTSYKIAETLEQGSVAMSTVIQNEKNDYDIDVAIIFDETNLNGLGSTAVKNMVVKALKKKCTGFKTEPEAKTNCVRIVYADNYHIDFAIYRRIKNDEGSYCYEHAGSKWQPRDPRAINNWFKNEIELHSEKLRQCVRLSKMFCKSRDSWNMPGGLIQSVLCDEKILSYDRMDEMFYYTMKEIQKRLNNNIEVYNPTDDTQSLLLKQSDIDKMNNLNSRLKDKLSKLDLLFDDECTKKQAIEAWNEFFNHSYWTYDEKTENRSFSLRESTIANLCDYNYLEYDDTEENIYNIMSVKNNMYIKIDCKVIDSYGTIIKLSTLNNRGKKVPLERKLEFYIDKNRVPKPYKVYWKVKNNGDEAIKHNCIRGQIFESCETIQEKSDFGGEHYVECYIVKNGICVATDKIDVPIE